VGDPVSIEDRLRAKMMHYYGCGIADGTEMCLRLLMGERVHNAAPCPQPIPDEVREWAAQALLTVEEMQREQKKASG